MFPKKILINSIVFFIRVDGYVGFFRKDYLPVSFLENNHLLLDSNIEDLSNIIKKKELVCEICIYLEQLLVGVIFRNS